MGMKHNTDIVICGGYYTSHVTGDCYSYSNDRWNIEAFKLDPVRYGATSIEIRPGEWMLMGGSDDGINILKDTLIFKNGIFTQGPDLPDPSAFGSAVMLNQTHLFFAASQYQSGSVYYSVKNYFFNIDTEQWTPIANRTSEQFHSHSSGTFFNSSNDELQVATIGRYGIEVYSPRDDSWHDVPWPPRLTYLSRSVAVQQGTSSFILIGGWASISTNSADIFLFDECGLSILKEDVLQVGRQSHVAMPISPNDFTCG